MPGTISSSFSATLIRIRHSSSAHSSHPRQLLAMPHACVIITIMTAAALILLPIGQSAPQQNNAELNELINRMANSPQLDRNAFRMSFGKRANGQPQQQKLQQKWPMMDGNSFRMSFGKRSTAAAGGQHEEMGEGQADQILTHANIPIPLLFDLADSAGLEPMEEESLLGVPNEMQQKNWPSRWKASLYRKRLDRNLFNVGFGRR